MNFDQYFDCNTIPQTLKISPCITCIQYGGVQYRGGVQYCGDIMMHVGDILSTVGMFSTVGNIIINVGIS